MIIPLDELIRALQAPYLGRPSAACAGSLLRWRWSVPVAAVLLFAVQAEAQDVIPRAIHESETVSNIEVRNEVTLGSLDDPFDLSALFVQVHRTEDGSWIVLSRSHERHSLARFGRDGGFRGTVGRRGEGPGEFRFLRAFTGIGGDSLLMVDLGGEYSVLDPDGHWVRGGRLGVEPLQVAMLPDGRFVAAANAASPELAGQPLHLVAQGEVDGGSPIVRSFGHPDGALDPAATDLDRQRIPVVLGATEPRVLSISRVDYRIEEWTLEGHLLRAWELRNAWFPMGSAESGEVASIRGAAMSPDGLLQVVFVVMDPSDEPVPEDPIQRFHDGASSVVEFIDLEAETLVARKRFPGWAPGFTSDGALVLSEQDEVGMVRLGILELGIRH